MRKNQVPVLGFMLSLVLTACASGPLVDLTQKGLWKKVAKPVYLRNEYQGRKTPVVNLFDQKAHEAGP